MAPSLDPLLLINAFQRLTKIIGDVKNDFGLRRERAGDVYQMSDGKEMQTKETFSDLGGAEDPFKRKAVPDNFLSEGQNKTAVA